MNEHPRAKSNRYATYAGLGFAAMAAVFGVLHPKEWHLWGGFLLACALFLQQDGLIQLAGQVVAGIRARFGRDNAAAPNDPPNG